MIVILIILLVIIILIVISKNDKEYLNYDPRDITYIPRDTDSSIIDEVTARRFFRIVPIYTNIKLDKFNRVESIFYKKPYPEQGETNCRRVKCPSWIEKIHCWKCE
jgi:hypothetical protein